MFAPEEALAESEADARSFMANMVDACAVCETVLNDHGEPVDIRLVEVNPAFSRELSCRRSCSSARRPS